RRCRDRPCRRDPLRRPDRDQHVRARAYRSAMTVLRCERVAAGDLDRAVADLGELTLARMPEGVFVDVADDRANDAVRRLAFAGICARPALVALAPRPGTYAALGRDLGPLPLGSLSLDLVHVRRLSVARESARLLRHPPWRRNVNADRRARCRDLLRGTDAALTLRRRARVRARLRRLSRTVRLRAGSLPCSSISIGGRRRSRSARGSPGRRWRTHLSSPDASPTSSPAGRWCRSYPARPRFTRASRASA